ncbi:MAG: hypothetical protein CMK32_05180, partial [Porticoccaceae bacterium]|nr:hypothetical protein [Porticoccaceae bacterium]
LAIDVGETQFESAQLGIGTSNLANARLVLNWMDLLRQRISVDALEIDGINLTLTERAQAEQIASAAAVPATGSEPVISEDGRFALAVSTVSLTNGRLQLVSDGEKTTLENFELATSDVNLDGELFPITGAVRVVAGSGDPVDIDLKGQLGITRESQQLVLMDQTLTITGPLPQPIVVNLSGNIDLNALSGKTTTLSLSIGEAEFEGGVSFASEPRRLDLSLTGNAINMDTLLPEMASAPATTAEQTAESGGDVNLLAPLLAPIALLEGGEGSVNIRLESLTSRDLILNEPNLSVHARNNQLTIKDLSTGLFDGKLTVTGVLRHQRSTPVVTFDARASNLALAEALTQLGKDPDVTGSLSFSLSGQTRGLTEEALLRNLAGGGNLNIENPGIRTINLEKSYCDVAALVEKDTTRRENWPAGTTLNPLTSDFTMENGVVRLQQYNTGIGNLKLRGNGNIDLLDQTFDIMAITRLEGDRTSDSGCIVKSKRVRDKDIPLRCKDSFATAGAKSCQPDPDFLKGVLQDEVLDKLIDDKDGEKAEAVKGLLKGLFNR